VILVGSVLLKLKSDIVSGQTFMFEESLNPNEDEAEDDFEDIDFDEVTGKELPPSSLEQKLLVRRIPKRKVTLPELIVFLKRVVTQVERKEIVRKEKDEQKLDLQVQKKNVERIMRDVYKQITKLAKGEKTTFKNLVDEWNKEAVVAYLMPVLHLANKEKIALEQKELFGDIFISPK